MNALEYAIFILLLLTGLLNSKRLSGAVWWLIAGLIALAFVVPVFPLDLPWDLFIAFSVPLLLWQIARQLVDARWPGDSRDLLLWVWVALGIGGVLLFTAQLVLSGAILFGLLAASIVWRGLGEDITPSYLGQIGPLALVFLLVEIDPAVVSPNRYLLSLLVGAVLGVFIGYLAVRIAELLPSQFTQNIWSLGHAYLAYLVGLLLGVSGVVAAVFSIGVYVASGTRRGLWPSGKIQPKPLDTTPVFLFIVAILTLIAWQVHVPFTLVILLDILLGLLVIAITIALGRFLNSKAIGTDAPVGRVFGRVSFLLVPALLLWPREVLLEPEPLALALGAALLTVIGTHLGLTPLMDFYARLEEKRSETVAGEFLFGALRVKDIMMTDFRTITPETGLAELVRIYLEERPGCLPVVDSKQKLVGIVRERDLFVKEEQLPMTGQTYLALFGEPIFPEALVEIFSEKKHQLVAADVITPNIDWVEPDWSVGRAIWRMVQSDYCCLPVLINGSQPGGELVGLITRSHLLQLINDPELISDLSRKRGELNKSLLKPRSITENR